MPATPVPSTLIYFSFDDARRIRAASDRAVNLWGLAAGEPVDTYMEILEPRDLSMRTVGASPLAARVRIRADGAEVRGLVQRLAPGRLCFVAHEARTGQPGTVAQEPAIATVQSMGRARGTADTNDFIRRRDRRHVAEAAATVRSGLDEIIATSREALDSDDEEGRRAAIQTIIQLADSLNGVTNRMLNAAADRASPPGAPAIASVAAACRDALARVGHLGSGRLLTIVHDHRCTRDAVFCDERGLVQTLANLLRALERLGGEANALGLEARDVPEESAVAITLWYRGPNAHTLLLRLQDTGDGDPGIAYVHTFVRAAAGRFDVREESADGLALTIELPAALTPRSDAETPVRGRALVVDDQAHARGQLERYLVKLGFQVKSVGCASEALAALAGRMPDVVFLDLLLPDLNGMDVLRLLRAKRGGGDVPVVVVSASDDVEASRAAGADAHLVKPLWRDQLGAVVDKVMRRRAITAVAE